MWNVQNDQVFGQHFAYIGLYGNGPPASYSEAFARQLPGSIDREGRVKSAQKRLYLARRREACGTCSP
jgi:hypothetical protein